VSQVDSAVGFPGMFQYYENSAIDFPSLAGRFWAWSVFRLLLHCREPDPKN
jgi:hypothetical protein